MKIRDEFSELNIQKVSIKEIELFTSKKILGHARPRLDISFEGLFRARVITDVHERELAYTSCIWYPVWSEIHEEKHKLNRCSDKGQNFFYSSNCLEATITELSPQNNDLILIGIFTPKQPGIKISSQFVGLKTIREINSFPLLQDYNNLSLSDLEIEEYFSKKFQERISFENDYEYKLTIAISNILLKNRDIGCLVYPSVAANGRYLNYGIKPAFVDSAFYCKTLHVYKVIKTVTEYTLVPERFAKSVFYNHGDLRKSRIEWKDNSNEDKINTRKYVF